MAANTEEDELRDTINKLKKIREINMNFGGKTECGRCEKTVYTHQEIIAAEKSWHKTCFVCRNCDKRLETMTCKVEEGEIYCKSCHGKLFGSAGV